MERTTCNKLIWPRPHQKLHVFYLCCPLPRGECCIGLIHQGADCHVPVPRREKNAPTTAPMCSIKTNNMLTGWIVHSAPRLQRFSFLSKSAAREGTRDRSIKREHRHGQATSGGGVFWFGVASRDFLKDPGISVSSLRLRIIFFSTCAEKAQGLCCGARRLCFHSKRHGWINAVCRRWPEK